MLAWYFYGYGSSYRSKFRSSLDMRSILYEKGLYIYFNAIDAPFEQPELWTYHVPALATATYGLSALVYASAFLAFLPLLAYLYFLYSLCVVLCALRKSLRAKFEL